MEHFHIVAIAADFLIEVISGMQAVGEYGVSILRAVVQYPLAAVQGSVLEVRGKSLVKTSENLQNSLEKL